MRCFFVDQFCYLCFELSVHCSLLVTCWERADILSLLYVMFGFGLWLGFTLTHCVFVSFTYGVLLGQEGYLIVSIPDLLSPFLLS